MIEDKFSTKKDLTDKIIPQIRSMNREDVDEVYIMGKGAPEFSLSDQANFWGKEELERWVRANNEDVLLVATHENKIIAFIFAIFHTPTGLATITNIFTKPEYRKKGIGRKLLGEAIKLLEEKGATYIDSLVHPDNEASMKLQESVGFRRGFLMRSMEKIPGSKS